ncbi:MAG: NAD(P)-dependent oxidoreductase, partial [Frankiales bacterium]|nr:NAD(P)-dependent oxidoreductase [Frankiales bacterium]
MERSGILSAEPGTLMSTYALTGATGRLGRLVVAELLDRGVAPTDLVAVARDAARAAPLVDLGVQVRIADYEQPDTLLAAFAGVERLLLVSGTEVGRRAAQHRHAVEAARAAGVQRLVYTSLLRADTNTMPLAQEHRVTEQLLRDSEVAHVVLRNGWYLENWTDQLAQYLAAGALVGAAGQARVAPAP